MAVNPIPNGYHTVTPYYLVENPAEFIDFLKEAFNATEVFRSALPDGTVMHAEVKIGNSMIMMGGVSGDYSPNSMMMYLYVEDSEAVYNQAIKAGATVVRELRDEFYGDRVGGVQDKFGHQWWIGTHVEDVSPEELERRQKEMQTQN